MLSFKPKYVTVDEFNNYWGSNLDELLRTNANDSNKSNAFLMRVEQRLMAYIDHNTFRRYKYEELRGEQLNAFKIAIIIQAMYVWKHGLIGMDSGYEPDKGIVAKRADLIEITLCQDAIDTLSNAGLWNLVMKNRPRKFGGGFVPGDFF